MGDLRSEAARTIAMWISTALVQAATWTPGILMDGSIDEWDGQVPILATHPSGGGGGLGRDVKSVSVANDGTYLYLRLESYNANVYDLGEERFIHGDNVLTTRFSPSLGVGSDLLVAGTTMACENTDDWWACPASPPSCNALPATATTNVEIAIPLATVFPCADIPLEFPGGLGSTIAFAYRDSEAPFGNEVVNRKVYTFALNEPATTGTVIDDVALYDTDSHAMTRTRDVSSAGCSVARARTAGPSGAGEAALATTHSLDPVAGHASLFAHRFIKPKDLTDHPYLALQVVGSSAASENLLIVEIVDLDGTRLQRSLPFPTAAGWHTIDLRNVSNNLQWLTVAPGANGSFQLDRLIVGHAGPANTATSSARTLVSA